MRSQFDRLAVLCLALVIVPAHVQAVDTGVSFGSNVWVTDGSVPGLVDPVSLYVLTVNSDTAIDNLEFSITVSGPNAGSWILSRGSGVGAPRSLPP